MLAFLQRLRYWLAPAGGPKPWKESARSPQWPGVRQRHLLHEPACQWCGNLADVQVHHVVPFWVEPRLELFASNLMSLCEPPGPGGCHLRHGHDGAWRRFNPAVRLECELRKAVADGGQLVAGLEIDDEVEIAR